MRSTRRGLWPLIACLVGAGLLLGGCNRYSKVTTASEEVYRVELTHGDAAAIYGTTPAGEKLKIERSEVLDVELPGNVALGVFIPTSSLVFGGMVATIYGINQYDHSSNDTAGLSALAAALGLGAVGLAAPVVWYAIVRRNQREAIEGGLEMGVSVLPTVIPAPDGRLGGGVGVGMRF